MLGAHSLQTQFHGRVRRYTRSFPQRGQRTPSGHRFSTKYSRQLSSVGNRSMSSVKVIMPVI
jgi:hypothetical protein